MNTFTWYLIPLTYYLLPVPTKKQGKALVHKAYSRSAWQNKLGRKTENRFVLGLTVVGEWLTH